MLKRILLAVMVAGSAVTAFGQDLAVTVASINITGTAKDSDYATTYSGTGSAVVSGLGVSAVTVSGTASRERGFSCGYYMQLTLMFSFSSSDSLSIQLTTPRQLSATTDTINSAFQVSGTTGLFVGRGGSGNINVTMTTAASGSFQMTGGATGTLTSSTSTKIATVVPSGIVPIYSSVPVIEPGSWISIFGTNLTATNIASLWNGDFPTTLAAISVTINGKKGFLWYASSTQINLQAPDDTPTGCVSVVVSTPNGSITTAVTLNNNQPSFSLLDAKHVAGTMLTPDGSGAYGVGTYDLVGPSNFFSYNTRPVRVGETVSLYGVGFGPLTPAVPAGAVVASGKGGVAITTPLVTIGGQTATVTYAGMTVAGLYQLNVVVPNVPSGDQVVQATLPSSVTGFGTGQSPATAVITVNAALR